MTKSSFEDVITQIGHFRDTGRPGFSVFLGAGASKSSGVPLADELADRAFALMRSVHRVADDVPASVRPETGDVRVWAQQQPWYDVSSKGRYQLAMERAFLSQPARAVFLKQHTQKAVVSKGYLRLAELLKAHVFDTVHTTNFDDLVRQGCSLIREPLVEVAALEQYRQQNPSPCDSRLIRLHGDFWHGNALNTEGELEKTPRIRLGTVHRLSCPQGMVVIGYGGGDRTIMIDLFLRYMSEREFLKNGLFWCIRRGSDIPPHLRVLIDKDRDNRIHLVEIDGFDEAMELLAAGLDRSSGTIGHIDSLRVLIETQALLTDGALLLTDWPDDRNSLPERIQSVFLRLVRQIEAKEGALLSMQADAGRILAASGLAVPGSKISPSSAILSISPKQPQDINRADFVNDELLLSIPHNRTIAAYPVNDDGKCLALAVFCFDSSSPRREYDDRVVSALAGLLVLATQRFDCRDLIYDAS